MDRAEAAISQAQANLERQRNELSVAKNDAELRVEQAANALRNAQDAYSQIYWDNQAERDRRDGDLPQELIAAEDAAKRAVDDAEAALNQARLAFERAQQNEVNGIAAAEAQVREAMAARDDLLSGPENDDVAAARARIARAEANLARLTGEEQSGRVEASDAAIVEAQANLEQVSAGPQAADLAVAQAQIRSAEVALAQAELALEYATLRSPFAGTVVAIELEVGELPDPTLPAIVLADRSDWKLETSDLTELDIAAVRVGSPVTITFDALPDLTLPGRIQEIEGLGRSFQGDVLYTVVVEPLEWDERLLWNMTATVVIEPEA
ncbi:MAG: HlyD family efflux transporter periplasmic adaptor subunit [Oscillochloris sp.]|nr:HlyD family efflux transporter periplasmic adaptor subunit [Oscillochloris sp.]